MRTNLITGYAYCESLSLLFTKIIMNDNKFLALAAIMFTICAFFAIYLGWDTEENYLRQGLLILAGYITAVIVNIVNEME